MHELKGKKILVTGGAGLVGSHIVDLLVREGSRIIVYDNFIRGKRENLKEALGDGDVEIIEGDIRDREKVLKVVEGVHYVFHQSAVWIRACQDDPRLALDVNVAGTFNVLEACAKHGVKKIVAASSSSVYGDGSYFPTDESHPFNNDLFYGASKIANEQFYRAYYKKYGLDFVAFRYLNVYGPRQPYQAVYTDVIMNFLNRIDANEPPIIDGDGTQTADLVFVEDVARANIMAMKSDVTNEFLNVASGKETTLKDLAHLLLELNGRADLEPILRTRESWLVTRRFGCPKRAKELLGFETTTSPREGLQKVIAWRQETERRT